MQLHLAVEDKVNVGFGGLLLLVECLVGLEHEDFATLEQMLEGGHREQVEYWMFQPDTPQHHFAFVVSLRRQQLVLVHKPPHLRVESTADLTVVGCAIVAAGISLALLVFIFDIELSDRLLQIVNRIIGLHDILRLWCLHTLVLDLDRL